MFEMHLTLHGRGAMEKNRNSPKFDVVCMYVVTYVCILWSFMNHKNLDGENTCLEQKSSYTEACSFSSTVHSQCFTSFQVIVSFSLLDLHDFPLVTAVISYADLIMFLISNLSKVHLFEFSMCICTIGRFLLLRQK